MVSLGDRGLPEVCLSLPRLYRSQTLWFPGSLPGLNELIAARISTGPSRGRHKKWWNQYSELKRKCEEQLGLAILACKLKPVTSGVFHYHFAYADKRRNPDNIAAGATKFIMDALVKRGIIKNDGWAEVLGLIHTFSIDREKPGIRLTIYSPK
jgi:hypothetical protein